MDEPGNSELLLLVSIFEGWLENIERGSQNESKEKGILDNPCFGPSFYRIEYD
jgi:hypothetical protein